MKADDCPFDGDTPVPRQPRISQSDESQSTVEQIISSPIDSLKFGDFAKLKSGTDKFSRMNLSQLQDDISEIESRFVSEEFMYDEKSQASCIRWMLRGLDCAKAIRKVKTDLTIAENATKRRR